MRLDNAWDDDRQVSDLIDVPYWIEQDIEVNQLAAIVQGGCDSGAYMPAVTYYLANRTMAKYGDEVLNYLQNYAVLPIELGEQESWSGFACRVLSLAVEYWASTTLDELEPDGHLTVYSLDNDPWPVA